MKKLFFAFIIMSSIGLFTSCLNSDKEEAPDMEVTLVSNVKDLMVGDTATFTVAALVIDRETRIKTKACLDRVQFHQTKPTALLVEDSIIGDISSSYDVSELSLKHAFKTPGQYVIYAIMMAHYNQYQYYGTTDSVVVNIRAKEE